MRTIPPPRKRGKKSIPHRRSIPTAHRLSVELLLTAAELRHLLRDLGEFVGDLESQARRVRAIGVTK